MNIFLPAMGPTGPQEAQEASRPDRKKSKAKVLLVDDEKMIRIAGKRMIEAIGYDVIIADSGASALDVYRDNIQNIDLVILDLSMPIMDGAECFEKLKEIDGDVRVLIYTGHGKSRDAEEMIANGAVGMMKKPFDLAALSEAVAKALPGQKKESDPVNW